MRKLLQQCLDYIKDIRDHCACEGIDCEKENVIVAALEKELAKPGQDTHCKHCNCIGCVVCDARCLPEQDHGFDRTASHMAGEYVDTAEQEPVCWITPDGEGFRMRYEPPINDVPLGWTALYSSPQQTYKQDPVAWRYKGKLHDIDPSDWASPEFAVIPLFTSPSRKEWVGLTDEEIHKIIDENTSDDAGQEELNDFALAIFAAQAALRSKNEP